MNYEYYKIFFTVARRKNITHAAQDLFSSQPAVTRVIHNMENELGCQLFIRNKSGVVLTREGKELYDLIEAPCNLLMRADQALRQSARWQEGTIHIGTTDTALQCFLFDFLETFRLKHPGIHFKIYTGSSSRMIAKLENGEIDLVLNTTPYSNSQTLSVTPVKKFHDILIGGSQYKALSKQIISLKDIQAYSFILLSQGMSYRHFCDAFFAAHNVTIEPALEADSSGLIIPMVTHNWGLAFVPELMAYNALNDGSIVKIPLAETLPCRYVTLVTDSQRPLSKIARLICEMIMNVGLYDKNASLGRKIVLGRDFILTRKI